MTLIEQVAAKAQWRMVGSEFPRWKNANDDTAAWPDELTGEGLRDLHLRLLHAGCVVDTWYVLSNGEDVRHYRVRKSGEIPIRRVTYPTIEEAVMHGFLETSNDEG